MNELEELLFRLRCRCGKMILEPSEKCEWHTSKAERAHASRIDYDSIEFSLGVLDEYQVELLGRGWSEGWAHRDMYEPVATWSVVGGEEKQEENPYL